MPNFQRRLDYTEITYGLLMVRENRAFFPKVGEAVTIIDEDGQRFETHMHRSQPRIDGLTSLLRKHNAKIGDLVSIEVEIGNIGTAKVKFDSRMEAIIEREEFEERREQSEDLLITPSLESMLEDFISQNLSKLEFGLKLYKDDDGILGRQYDTDVGVIDLLCLDTNNNYVVIELKKGKETDRVVGQISRYIGWVKEKIAKNSQEVRGIIIVHRPTDSYPKDDKLFYAVKSNAKLELRYYEISLNFFERGKNF